MRTDFALSLPFFIHLKLLPNTPSILYTFKQYMPKASYNPVYFN